MPFIERVSGQFPRVAVAPATPTEGLATLLGLAAIAVADGVLIDATTDGDTASPTRVGTSVGRALAAALAPTVSVGAALPLHATSPIRQSKSQKHFSLPIDDLPQR